MKIIIATLFVVLLMSGCVDYHTSISNRKSFEFQNTNDSIKNDEKCLELCKGREGVETVYNGEPGTYHCDYEPVICNGDTCLCKTY
jgi:hypothetical protein